MPSLGKYASLRAVPRSRTERTFIVRGEMYIRRRKAAKHPTEFQALRVRWLIALVGKFGTVRVAQERWEPPHGWGFEEWRAGR